MRRQRGPGALPPPQAQAGVFTRGPGAVPGGHPRQECRRWSARLGGPDEVRASRLLWHLTHDSRQKLFEERSIASTYPPLPSPCPWPWVRTHDLQQKLCKEGTIDSTYPAPPAPAHGLRILRITHSKNCSRSAQLQALTLPLLMAFVVVAVYRYQSVSLGYLVPATSSVFFALTRALPLSHSIRCCSAGTPIGVHTKVFSEVHADTFTRRRLSNPPLLY